MSDNNVTVSVCHLPCYLTEDEEGEQMDYLGGDAALKHHKQMAKFRQASCLSPNRMSPTSRPVRIYAPTHNTSSPASCAVEIL